MQTFSAIHARVNGAIRLASGRRRASARQRQEVLDRAPRGGRDEGVVGCGAHPDEYLGYAIGVGEKAADRADGGRDFGDVGEGAGRQSGGGGGQQGGGQGFARRQPFVRGVLGGAEHHQGGVIGFAGAVRTSGRYRKTAADVDQRGLLRGGQRGRWDTFRE